ncbi:tyrosine-type recombinase/integrase [Novipirellula aureliae]|uniref:tyrosine-type recombinase/integrase n=1 Tax=Novipirellula aureliae TaxID=2527966 RepID=UPI0011B7DB93|nr:site-specific integrase [Novipirellula aureliae]
MASLRKESDRGRTGWRLRFYVDKKQRSLYLSDPSKRRAESVMRHVDELVRAKAAGVSADAATAKWADDLDGRLFDALARIGLVDAKRNKSKGDAGRLLGPFCDAYIASRTDLAQGTIDNYGHARRLLVEKFGERCVIGSITEGDAERWRRWLLTIVVKRDADGKPTKTMAEATVSKHVKRAKTLFSEAVKDRLLTENPFLGLKTNSEVNRDRDHYINRQTATKVLTACPDHDWRLIFALARFAGLRRCEVLALTWADVLWDVDRLRIDSPKTGLRFCPIFPELMPFLRASFEAAPDGANRCIQRYHRLANLGTQLNRIIESAGLVPWEKTFGNLRATRRTELQERYQDHVVNSWMGHSSKTAAKHYLQVTDDHWAAGATAETGEPIDTDSIYGGLVGGLINADQDASREITEHEKTRKTLGFTGSGFVRVTPLATPQGLEP